MFKERLGGGQEICGRQSMLSRAALSERSWAQQEAERSEGPDPVSAPDSGRPSGLPGLSLHVLLRHQRRDKR